MVESPQMGKLMETRIPKLSLWGFNVTPCDTPKIANPFFGLDLAGWRLMVIFIPWIPRIRQQKSPSKQIQGYTSFMDAMWEKKWKIV